ncbi:MAG: hypothetical protein OXO52_21545 [Rhodospirillales bacterium]|nr:hypothetical protein [Rhodospirillales bacterium]MDE0381415.1 hypothetical protein [Rhodospirillales bacterium]
MLKIAEALKRLSGGETTPRRLIRGSFIPVRLACEGACRDIDVAPAPDSVRTLMAILSRTIRQANPFEHR